MRRLLLGLALLVASTPLALACNPTMGTGAQAVTDCSGSGPAQSQAQQQHQHQTQNSTANGGAARATGGNATGGTASGGSVVNTISGSGYGGGNFATSAPSITLPSLGGGGMDCPTVGLAAGGSGLGGGGGIGPSWISPDCNARKLAALLFETGHPDLAMAVLRDQFPIVDKTMKRAESVPVATPPAPVFVPAKFCAHATAIERKHNPGSCGPQS